MFSTQVSTSEQVSQTSKLVLPQTACTAFPLILDYIYGGADEEHFLRKLTKETVVALHYLADYLQIQTLLPITTSYIKSSLKETNVHLYCREAILYKIDWVIKSCIHVAAYSPAELTLPIVVATTTTTTTNEEEDNNHNDTTTTTSATLSPAQQTMAMLPAQQQIELLQLALTKTVNELKQFKRVPSRWNENINDARATHVPTLMKMEYPMQGLTLPFPGRICPIFYFDSDVSSASGSNNDNNSNNNDGGGSNSPLAADPPTVGVAITTVNNPYPFSVMSAMNMQPRTPRFE